MVRTSSALAACLLLASVAPADARNEKAKADLKGLQGGGRGIDRRRDDPKVFRLTRPPLKPGQPKWKVEAVGAIYELKATPCDWGSTSASEEIRRR